MFEFWKKFVLCFVYWITIVFTKNLKNSQNSFFFFFCQAWPNQNLVDPTQCFFIDAKETNTFQSVFDLSRNGWLKDAEVTELAHGRRAFATEYRGQYDTFQFVRSLSGIASESSSGTDVRVQNGVAFTTKLTLIVDAQNNIESLVMARGSAVAMYVFVEQPQPLSAPPTGAKWTVPQTCLERPFLCKSAPKRKATTLFRAHGIHNPIFWFANVVKNYFYFEI